MREELIIRILTKSAKYLSDQQLKQIRNILDEELYNYTLTSNSNELIIHNDIYNNLALYLASKKLEGVSDNTLKNYYLILNKFAKTIQKNIDKINVMDIRKYLAVISQSGLKNSSISTIIWTLKGFFNWLFDNGKILENPMKLIKNIKCEKHIRKPLTKTELEMVRYACKTHREKALIEFFYSTGCRLDEAVKINKSDIDWNTGKLLVFGKGNKERFVFLNERAKLYLQKYLSNRNDNNEALFVGVRSPYNRLSRRGIERIFTKLGEYSKLKNNFFPHKIRHTTATHLLQNGMPIHEVQKYLGHSSADTTEIYLEVDTESVRINHNKFLS